MRFAIFGDIHANLHALHAVMADAQENACDRFVCMGDIVGYNAYPRECVEFVRSLDCPVVQGNHDEQVCLSKTSGDLNPLAEEAIDWTRRQLGGEDIEWLRGLRLQRQVLDFTIVHATLDTPAGWKYVTTELDAEASLGYQRTPLCFIGHTHVPRAYIRAGRVRAEEFDVLHVKKSEKYLVNVGSVGQPRDGDWRAAYCIYDTDSSEIYLRRIPYDVDGARKAVLDAGLPGKLADRLAKGK